SMGKIRNYKDGRNTKTDDKRGKRIAVLRRPRCDDSVRAICQQRANQRRRKGDVSHIRTRKTSDKSRKAKGDTYAKQAVVKRRSPVADAGDERQQSDERKKVFEGSILIVREIGKGHAGDGRISCRGK